MTQVFPIFNEPQTGNVFTNANGHKLHFRIASTPTYIKAKSVVFFIPGYSNHVNSPEIKRMGKNLGDRGIISISIDMEGHGYSEGTRCYIPHFEHFVRDVVQFVSCMMNEHASNTAIFFDKDLLSFRYQNLPELRKLPFFIMGCSMGGGIASLAAHQLWNKKHGADCTFPNFRGVLFQAPFLTIVQPGCFMTTLLKTTVGTCASTAQIPTSMSKTGIGKLLYKSPEDQNYFEMDTWGRPGALGWNQGMRWGSVLMFLDMGAAIDAIRHEIAYPFMILHDPGDELTDIAGSRQLLEESATEDAYKELIEVPGYLHGLLVNETDKVCEYSAVWMDQILNIPAASVNRVGKKSLNVHVTP